jgi:hypothetical protein
MLGLGLGLDTVKSRSVPSGGVQGNRWDDPDTFFTSVVTRGGVGITGSLYSDADTFFTATVAVDGGPQTITANLYSDADSFFASTVNSTYPATGDFYQDPDTFFTATVSITQAITGALFLEGDTFFASTVANSGGSIDEPDVIFGADLLSWHDAQDAGTLTYDGSNFVSSWLDKTANNNDLTGSGSNKPVYTATGGVIGNGALPSILFADTSDTLVSGTNAMAMGSTDEWSVFMVCRNRNQSNYPFCISYVGSSDGGDVAGNNSFGIFQDAGPSGGPDHVFGYSNGSFRGVLVDPGFTGNYSNTDL